MQAVCTLLCHAKSAHRAQNIASKKCDFQWKTRVFRIFSLMCRVRKKSFFENFLFLVAIVVPWSVLFSHSLLAQNRNYWFFMQIALFLPTTSNSEKKVFSLFKTDQRATFPQILQKLSQYWLSTRLRNIFTRKRELILYRTVVLRHFSVSWVFFVFLHRCAVQIWRFPRKRAQILVL